MAGNAITYVLILVQYECYLKFNISRSHNGSIVGGKEAGRGIAKGKQDAKNMAAQEALSVLHW
jgi:dsRNA-specific ribonuclease